MDKSASFFDSIAPVYDDLYTDRVARAENETVRAALAKRVYGKVLDLGCGTGLGAEMIGPGGVTYFGIDTSHEMIKQARAKFGHYPPSGYWWYYGDVVKLNFASEQFDAVICLFSSIAYSDNLTKAIKEAARVLRPGGYVYLMTFSRLRLGPRQKVRHYGTRGLDRDGCFIWLVTAKRFKQLAALAGLTGQVRGLNFALKVLPRRIDNVICRLAPDLGHSLIFEGRKD